MVSLGLLPKHLFSCQVIKYLLWFAAISQNYATREDVYMSMDVDIGVPGNVTAVAMKYESMVGVSLESCVDQCKRRSFCSYISYAMNAHVCFMIKHVNQSQTATFRKRAGYVLGKKAEWDMTSYTDCDICTINETCVRDGASTRCTHTACGPPEIPENAILLGNMYNTGSRLLIRCMNDTWWPQGDQVQITCLSSGLWTSTDTNVALGRPAWQSSNHSNDVASLGVDGITDQNHGSGSCFHTILNVVERPWWVVDLGAIFRIKTVVAYNRQDCCAERFSNVSIVTSRTNDLSNHELTGTLCIEKQGPFTEPVITFTCLPDTQGRYLKIIMDKDTEPLHLCEVQVFGETIC